jgi:hypothetical protein
MVSSGMSRRVALVRTNVLEELSTSIIRMTRIGELGTLAITSNQHALRSTSEMSALTRATWRNIPEDASFHCHCCENLKSYTLINIMYRYLGSYYMFSGIQFSVPVLQ